MSRNIFRDGLGKGSSSGRGGRYKLPEAAADRELVETLFKRYISLDSQGEIGHHEPRYLEEVACLEGLVPDVVAGQTTLDGMMFKLSHKISPELRWHSGGFLTALVQVLYNRGENGFVIDTSLWEGHPPFLGWFLKGKGDRLLELLYRGSIGQFARDTDYCDLTLIGAGTTCATNATHSVFRLKMPEGQSMHQLGCNGSDNRFYAEGRVTIAGAESHDSTYYLSEWPNWESPEPFERFLENGNILYIGKDGTYEKIGS